MSTTAFINTYLATCATALDPEPQPLPHSPIATRRWEAPAQGNFKINTLSPSLDPEHGEYLAAKSGLEFVRFLGLQSVTLESDCLALISVVNENVWRLLKPTMLVLIDARQIMRHIY
ncbi:hypothetical protein M569_15325 [Genlisea aurea]|uniref:RNase H type-1 domain-containing protein n=1 Tax=Genlisea aurea TaxID=192259 RepID=S8D9X7_9LAMI|nr:hypothetical protein M569_15325 [Genlisea aurea]